MEINLLPDVIILDIISRLPVESVLDCRSVCKTWQALTYHPSFAHLHLQRRCSCSLQLDDDKDVVLADAAAEKVGFVTLIKLEDKKQYQISYGEYNDDGDRENYKKLTKISQPLDNNPSRNIVNSCNGLICISVTHVFMSDTLCICNPITREYVNLPRSLPVKGYTVCGFGYHRKANEYEYKVVKIFYVDLNSVGQVQVYTLGSGFGWRCIGEIKYKCHFSSGVLANGALHWVDNRDGKIVSFDLANEVFRLLPSPPPSFGVYYRLQVLGGFLCALDRGGGDGLKIWALKKKKKSSGSYDMMEEQDYDQSWSWSLEFTIELEGMGSTGTIYNYDPFYLTKNGELLIWYNRTVLLLYSLKTRTLETLVDYAQVSKHIDAIPHINSFISLRALGEDANMIGSAEEHD